jgi:hypothetical protein
MNGLKRASISLLITAIAICALALVLPAPAGVRMPMINFEGTVYYAEGTTPVPGIIVSVCYPAGSSNIVNVTTNATGYYSSPMEQNGSQA